MLDFDNSLSCPMERSVLRKFDLLSPGLATEHIFVIAESIRAELDADDEKALNKLTKII